ncbi:MAG TPA: shikimate kinase [Candidatus Binatia bacterium]
MPRDIRKNIALTGFMAVGKSAVGRRLAERLQRPFVDLDRAIEFREGMTVEEIFSTKGEAYFRGVEKETLKEVLGRDGQVIATGGGAVLDEDNLRLLRERSLLIRLTASPHSLLKRSGRNQRRPLLQGPNRRERIEDLLAERENAYRQAHLSLDTSLIPVNTVVEKIIEEMNRRRGKNEQTADVAGCKEAGKADDSDS